MVADDIVNAAGIHDLRDIVKQLVGELLFYRVHQRDFIVHDQKGIVGGTAVGGIAVKIPDIPVHRAHIVNAFRHFDCRHSTLFLSNLPVGYYSSLENSSLLAPQMGHSQSSGRSPKAVPGSTPLSGSPSAGS